MPRTSMTNEEKSARFEQIRAARLAQPRLSKLESAARWRDNPDRRAQARARTKKWREENPERHAANIKNWHAKNKDKARKYSAEYHRKFQKCFAGITRFERDVIIVGHGPFCDICGTDDPGTKGWCLDHNHETGKIRGVLCQGCNRGIGFLKDDPEIIRRAANYVEQDGTLKE